MFAALLPPDRVVEDLVTFLAPRQEAEPGFRWTASDQWHVTLAFMPEVHDRHLDELVERLAAAAARRTPLEVRIVGGGAFPDPARAKVLYAGVETDRDGLDRLAAGARAAASTSGAPVDGTRFHPHVTLARTGRPAEVTRWLRVLEGYRGPGWRADEVALVASHLGEGPRRRPRYELVDTFPLTGTAPGPDGERRHPPETGA